MSNRFEHLSRPRQALLLGAIGLLIFVALAATAEGIVRVRQWVKHGHYFGIEDLYQVDPRTGLRVPVAGKHLGNININSLGFRGPEIAVPKPPGTIRIAFLGASTTFCAEVSSDDAAWPNLVTRALQERWPNRRFDYVNAAVPGYVVESSLKNFELRVKPLKPDVIVIYHATNDLSGNSYAAARAQGLVKNRGDLALAWPARYSLLWYLVEKNLMVMKAEARAADPKGKLKVDPQRLAAPFRRDLTDLVKRARETAKVVAVATFSTHLRPNQSPSQQAKAAETSLYYMPYMTTDGLLKSFAAYNQVIRDVAADLNVVLIDGEDTIPGDPAHFVDSVHFSDAGSRLMAQRVVNGLVAGGLAAAFGL